MSISNYAELQTAVANYLHRSDLTTLIPDFISIAESKLNRVLRLRAMENVTTGTVASSIALPTGFIEMISLTTNSGGATRTLTYVPPTGITSDAGTALNYTLVGDNLYFIPTGGGETYTLTYYKKFDAVSAGTNWLISNAPEVYVYAALIEAAPYVRDNDQIAIWQGYLNNTISQLQAADRKDRYGSDLLVRPA